jgi:membrane-anchored glycerophosphoryl diester phosphodiesterase (GDPDase)
MEVLVEKCILLTIIALLFGMTLAFAHPASLINAVFDKDKNNLIVSFSHKVTDPANHYIKQINVKLNKKDVLVQNCFQQETENGGTFYYKLIDAKAGDNIIVTAECSKYGKKSATVVVK